MGTVAGVNHFVMLSVVGCCDSSLDQFLFVAGVAAAVGICY